jgi:protein phosphatase
MATTLIGALFVEGHAVIGNLGDSRVYRLRHAFVKQVTCDHVLQPDGFARLSAEEADLVRPLVQLLTRAVGHHSEAEPDLSVEALQPEDAFLFCSNGLSDMLERHRIGEVLSRATSLEHGCELLVQTALAAGADDDVTVLLVQPDLSLRVAR